jgi:hypothetical protein
MSKRRVTAKPGRDLTATRETRPLVHISVDAAFRDGVLYASWDDHDSADEWQIVVRGTDRRIATAALLPKASLATQISGLGAVRAPYTLHVFGRRERRNSVVGRVEGLRL